MEASADHIHWGGGDWTDLDAAASREHSDAGGGHAHSGCMIYLGDNLPDEYRNSLFTCNIHGNRLNHDCSNAQRLRVRRHARKDFLFANDPWFRGIAVHYGPDGGVYVSDWSDTGECHNYDASTRRTGGSTRSCTGTPKAVERGFVEAVE